MPRRSSLALVLLTMATLLSGCRGTILGVVRSTAAENMAADLPAELPDGLHVLLCGAGSPLADPDRSEPCVAIIAGTSVFVVDAGAAAARNLARFGLDPGRVERVFLTHFHSDHIDGLGELATMRWVGAAHAKPLPVFGPEGVEPVVEGFNLAYRADAGYRTAHHGEDIAPTSGAGLTARPFPLPAAGEMPVLFEAGDVRVRAFAVDHDPVSPAVGYRIDYKDRSIAISGDTDKSQNLIESARGVDLLVHEALSPELVGVIQDAARDAGRADRVKITGDIMDYHASPVEAAESARDAGADYLLFYHIVPPLPISPLEGIFTDGVSDVYDGDFTIGIDGTFVSLPAGSEEIEVSQR